MPGMSGAVSGAYVDAIEQAAFVSGIEPNLGSFAPAASREEGLADGGEFERVDAIGNREPVNGRTQVGEPGKTPTQAQPDPRETEWARREAALAEREARIASMMEKMAGSFMAPPKAPEVKPEAPKGPEYKSLESSMTPEEWAELDAATRLRIRELDATHRANFDAIAQSQSKIDLSPVEQKIQALEQQLQQERDARQMSAWRQQAAQAEQVFGPALEPHRVAIAEYAMQHGTDIGTAIRVVCPQVWEAKIVEQAMARARAQFANESRAAQLWPGGVGTPPKNLEYEDGESFMDSARKVAARAAAQGQGRVGGPGLY